MFKHKKIFHLSMIIAVTCGAFSIAFANTCPTDLKKDKNGFYYSDEKPGWKAYKMTSDRVTLKGADFGGVVYSPERQRLACVYKSSDSKWVALVSNINNNIVIDLRKKNDSGRRAAWEFSQEHKDYSCGFPAVRQITGCEFSMPNKPNEMNAQLSNTPNQAQAAQTPQAPSTQKALK